jgi:hypothetical protein
MERRLRTERFEPAASTEFTEPLVVAGADRGIGRNEYKVAQLAQGHAGASGECMIPRHRDDQTLPP